MAMAFAFPVPEARDHLEELVARAQRDHERVVLTEQGEPAAVLISVDELDELQHAQDLADIALCEAASARSGSGLLHEEFMAELDAEEQGHPEA
jgi:prevent-host-death family protein